MPVKPPPSRLFRFVEAQPRDPAVEAWLARQPDELASLARLWFDHMRACGSDIRELLHDGHPTACVDDAAFGYVNAFTAHVNVGFFQGATLPDPTGLLRGTGKAMRHVRIAPDVPVDVDALVRLIHAASADMRARLKTDGA